MTFTSPIFLVFLTAVIAAYWVLPWNRARLGLLLAASYIFYAAWSPLCLVHLVAITAVNYAGALGIARWRGSRPGAAKWLMATLVVVDLGSLALLKYYGFAANSLNGLFGSLGYAWRPPHLDLFMPLGISFYVFLLVAYVVDVRRGGCKAVSNPVKMAVFVAFFPKVVAGPIVRASEIMGQFDTRRRFHADRFLHGLDLMAIGFFKKAIIADQLAIFVNMVFDAPQGAGAATSLLGVYAYAAQIYCDFSGYTDIARGCSCLLGYELPINFRLPYLAHNILEFWRRWHITLGAWLRDYLYIPLGGSRKGAARTYLNLVITMALAGLWHGANWCFVVWGLLHGISMALTRFFHDLKGVKPHEPLFKGRLYKGLAIFVTFQLICLGWVFFRAPTFRTAFTILGNISSMRVFGKADLVAIGYLNIAIVTVVMFALLVMHLLSARLRRTQFRLGRAWLVLRPIVYFAVIAGLLMMANRGPQQFIYAQF